MQVKGTAFLNAESSIGSPKNCQFLLPENDIFLCILRAMLPVKLFEAHIPQCPILSSLRLLSVAVDL